MLPTKQFVYQHSESLFFNQNIQFRRFPWIKIRLETKCVFKINKLTSKQKLPTERISKKKVLDCKSIIRNPVAYIHRHLDICLRHLDKDKAPQLRSLEIGVRKTFHIRLISVRINSCEMQKEISLDFFFRTLLEILNRRQHQPHSRNLPAPHFCTLGLRPLFHHHM